MMVLKQLKLQLKLQLSRCGDAGFGGASSSSPLADHLVVPTDLGRAWGKVKGVLLLEDARLQQIWQDSKARARQQLSALWQDDRSGAQRAAAPPPEPLMTPSTRPECASPSAVPQAELDAMLGSDGWLRVGVRGGVGGPAEGRTRPTMSHLLRAR